MDTIKINDMQTKGVVFIVKYNNMLNGGQLVAPISEATLNVNFNKQEIWYLENEVGVGGTVKVEITNKPKNPDEPSAGYWVNITKVDMKSAVKGEQVDVGPMIAEHVAICQGKKPDREKTIIAQCLTKVFCRNLVIPADEPKTVLDAYNYFLNEL